MNGKAILVWLISSLLLTATLSSSLAAQDYESLPIDKDFIMPSRDDFDTDKAHRDAERPFKARHSAARSAVVDAVKSGSSNFGPDGDKYMLNYRLASMTQTSDRYLNQLGLMRTNFLKLYMSRSSSAVRRSVIAKVLPELQKIALGDFHPAVRVNAVTMIGLLDERAGNSSEPPTPSNAAYQSLKKIWSTGDAPDAVRAGAISGIRRFAEISRRGTDNVSMVGDFKGELISILKGSAAGQDKWKADFEYWMKRRATQMLGYIGEGTDVVDSVDAVMKTKSVPDKRNNFWLRYDGLEALANLRFSQLDRGKVSPLVDDVLGFVADALELEAGNLQAQVDDLVYTNILWGNYDLKNTKSRRPRGGSTGGGRGDGGGRGERGEGGISGFGGTGGGGGLGMGGGPGDKGGGMPGGGRGGGIPGGRGGGIPGGGRGGGPVGGGRGGFDLEDRPHRVELPVFMLNNSRAKLKAILVTALRFMDEPRTDPKRGIVAIADDATKAKIIDDIVPLLNDLIKETEVGVIDFRSKAFRNQDPEEIDVTHEMMEICRKQAKEVRSRMTNPPKQEQEVAAPGGIEDLNQ